MYAGKIHRVLMNRAGNAIKFTHGGSVRIEVERHNVPTPRGDANEFRLRISDMGIGIAND